MYAEKKTPGEKVLDHDNTLCEGLIHRNALALFPDRRTSIGRY